MIPTKHCTIKQQGCFHASVKRQFTQVQWKAFLSLYQHNYAPNYFTTNNYHNLLVIKHKYLTTNSFITNSTIALKITIIIYQPTLCQTRHNILPILKCWQVSVQNKSLCISTRLSATQQVQEEHTKDSLISQDTSFTWQSEVIL